MLDSTLNTTNLRNAFKIAAPQFGLSGVVTPQPSDGTTHATPYQSRARQQRPISSSHRPQFMRGLDRGH